MAVRAAVARHVLQLTLRREFATASRLARDEKPSGSGSAHDWATQVLGLPPNSWAGTVVPPPPSPKPRPKAAPKPRRAPPKAVGKDEPGRAARPAWARAVAAAVVDKPPPRSRRGWGPARITRPPPEPEPARDLGLPPARELPADGETAGGRLKGELPILALIQREEMEARSGGPRPPETASPRQSEQSAPTPQDASAPLRGTPASSGDDVSRSGDAKAPPLDPPTLSLEDAAPSLLGSRTNELRDGATFWRVPKDRVITHLGREVPPWSRRDLRPNSDITAADILDCPPRWAPNRILAYLATVRTPTRAGPMHAHLRRLRTLIEFIVPPNWGNLSAYRQRALLTLWSHWLQMAARLKDLGALPRMRGWEGREFAPERFDSLFLAIVGGRVKPGKGEKWDKWRARFKIDDMTPATLPNGEPGNRAQTAQCEQPTSPPPSHAFGLRERKPEPPVWEKGPVTHYTPPTLYADSPVEKHVEYDVAYARAMKMRGEALAAMRKKRARDALRAISVAVAFMGTVEARPTEFQLQLIFTHLMDHISFKEIAQYLSEEEEGPMHDVAARLQKVIQPWVTGPSLVEDDDVSHPAITTWDSDNHLPARGQGRRMHSQRKQLLLTVGDMVMSRIEGGGDPETYRRWLDAAEGLVPEWHFMVARYESLCRDASAGQPLRAPTNKEGHALHLLTRYAIARLPRTGVHLPPGLGGTLADPLHCLRLLLGVDAQGARYYPRLQHAPHNIRSKDVDERINAVSIRWARAAAQRSLLAPALELLRLLTAPGERSQPFPSACDTNLAPGHGSGPPPIPLRLAIYLAGSATAPEDIGALLPLLERVDVAYDAEIAQNVDTAGWKMKEEQLVGRLAVERTGPHAVLVRALMLARDADGMTLRLSPSRVEAERQAGEEGEEGAKQLQEGGDGKKREKSRFEERMRRMFARWGLPEMGHRGETHGRLLQSRTMAPGREVEMAARHGERARRRGKERGRTEKTRRST